MRKVESSDKFSSADIGLVRSTCGNGNSNIVSLGEDLLLVDNLSSSINGEMSSDPTMLKDLFSITCISGDLRMRVNWDEIEMHDNDVVILPPGCVTQWISFSEGSKLVITGMSEKFQQDPGIDAEVVFMFKRYLNRHAVLHLRPDYLSIVLDTYQSLRRILTSSMNYKDNAVFGLMRVGLTVLVDAIERNNKADGDDDEGYSHQKAMLDRFLDLVSKYHMQERSVTFYADKMCLTPKYLSQVIYKASNRYAVDWIREQVIFSAKALLRSRQYNIQQVANKLAFPNPSFFGKYFKQVVGCSPRQYMMRK